MTHILETFLAWAARQLPEEKRVWISDLRAESKHIPGQFARQRFMLSGVVAAMGQILRVRFGVQRVGQTLLGAALLLLCIGGSIVATGIENHVVRTAFAFVMPLYLAGVRAGDLYIIRYTYRLFAGVHDRSFIHNGGIIHRRQLSRMGRGR
jgi:hypothetical protein